MEPKLVVASSSPAPQTQETHPILSLFAAAFWAMLWLLDCARSIIAFVTITVPIYVYAILSYSLTLTLDFWTLFFLFAISLIVLSFYVRFKYLNPYEHLTEPPLEKPDAKELHPDVNTTFFGEGRGTFHNYLDEFLMAIRVFGFLEKPVFHELARHLQTRRLIAGDTLSLDSDKSFYCVIDGTVQVFAQTNQSPNSTPMHWEDEGLNNGYQLLNEVGSGGTLSSLFTILSLFTEEVKISWRDEETVAGNSERGKSPPDPPDWDVTPLDLENRQPSASNSRLRRRSSTGSLSSGSTSTAHRLPAQAQSSKLPYDFAASRLLQGTVARATEDTTLAVIPAEAFRRVTKKFPKASAHIVQVILTRFSRVTFNAAHKYLGLTSELLRAEKAMNDMACHPLPRGFYEGGGLQKLRQRFVQDTSLDDEGDDLDTELETDYFNSRTLTYSSPVAGTIALPSISAAPRAPTKPAVNTRILSSSLITESPTPSSAVATQNPGVFHRAHTSRDMVQAGDLHTTAVHPHDMPRVAGLLATPHPDRRSQEFGGKRRRKTILISLEEVAESGSRAPNLAQEDFNLRDEVMACIAKSIGLIQPPLSGDRSTEISPVLRSFSPEVPRSAGLSSAFNRGGVFSSSFGSLSMLDVGDDVSSVSAGSASNFAPGSEYMSGLDNEVEVLFFPAGSVLVKPGEQNAGLFYVIDGFLDISMPTEEREDKVTESISATDRLAPSASSSKTNLAAGAKRREPSQVSNSRVRKDTATNKHLFTVTRGGIAGYLASLSGIASYVNIRAKTDTYVGFLPSDALNRLLEKRPIVLLTLSKRLLSLLSPLVLQIDSALDWVHVNAGQVLWRPGDVSDSLYIVINGRLRALRNEDNDRVSIAGEYGQGDTVGELDVITGSKRTETVHAIRDTELVQIPLTLFNAVSRNPQATVHLLKRIASRVRDEMEIPSTHKGMRPTDQGRKNLNLKTVAILPVSSNVPITAFSKRLHSALESIGAPTAYLNQASVISHVGRHAFTRMGNLKAAGWLAEQEQKYRIVLYVVDSPVSSQWTQTCIRQADYIMVVGMGEDPAIGEYERLLLSSKTTARKELVLLHPERSVAPGSTRGWLKNRSWIHAHFHVELPGLPLPKVSTSVPASDDLAPVAALKKVRARVQTEIQKYRASQTTIRPPRPDHASDFARLARRLCGRTIGVVLGGGGARGISHLGVLRALEDYGIPVDHVCGTSIGAFIGGLYARDGDILTCNGRAKHFASRMSSIWRLLADVTYPIVAYTTGHAFNRAIYKAFFDLHIEDMWLPYFCNSTNILTSRMEIHETGYAWRYIRASMTLVGLLPPLCDNGQMLVDGGYMDNLPVSAMLDMGAHAIFAVDVGSVDDTSPRDFGDSVSGWWLLVNRWNPFSSAKAAPPITEIQSRLAYVSSVKTLEEAKSTSGVLYMRMPVEHYGTLQWGKFAEIQAKGYEAALDMLAQWDQDHKLPSYTTVERSDTAEKGRKGRGQRRNSI